MSIYSRHNPSPRYRELVELYRVMHREGEPNLGMPPEKTFAGQSLTRHIHQIKTIVDILGSRRLLDYGSGKARQYDSVPVRLPNGKEFPGIKRYWGVEQITCYDPAYEPLAQLPQEVFDGVICTDVLEHCPEEDVEWIISEIFSFAREFVYLNVACYPAKKHLPNGENAHCTIKPPEWWKLYFDTALKERPGLRYFAMVETQDAGKIRSTLMRGK